MVVVRTVVVVVVVVVIIYIHCNVNVSFLELFWGFGAKSIHIKMF